MDLSVVGPQVALTLIGLVGIAITLIGAYLIYKGYKSAFWPDVIGEITEIGIKDDSDSDGACFTPTIKYEYEANGIKYSGNSWHFNFMKSFAKVNDAQKYIESYSLGMKVKVFYEPDKPATSVLIASIDASAIAFALVGGFITLFCLLKYLAE